MRSLSKLSYRALALASFTAAGGLTATQPAHAVLTEPNGLPIPQPLTEDISGGGPCCGATEANMSLQSLFTYLGETLDPVADARLEPQVFSPQCGFKGQLVLRGGGCAVDFGWYNVDPLNPEVVPPDEAIFPIVRAADYALWGANDAFWPRVPVGGPPCDDPPVCTAASSDALPPEQRWSPVRSDNDPGVQALENIKTDPRYTGGLIGFAVRANPSSVCTVTKYSQHNLNQRCTLPECQNQPWINAIFYKSTRLSNAFYIGFEDLPTSPVNFQEPTPEGYSNDGDFNDFVYLIQGITCPEGGQPCPTGDEGACGLGLTECDPDGNVICVPMIQKSAEVCDNIDNDCNGQVDEGDNLCDLDFVCDKGQCVGSCSTGEFPCPAGLSCDQETGLCIDPACVDVACDAGQVCIQGQCLGGCGGVQCPLGQRCQLGRCVDSCAGRTCPEGQVCEGGLCVERCDCRACPQGWGCDFNTGQCQVIGCVGAAPCPAGQVCIGVPDPNNPDPNARIPQCFDACEGVVCPGGGECVGGQCGDPKPGFTPPPGTENTSAYSIPSVQGFVPVENPQQPQQPQQPGPQADGDDSSGCGCRTAGTPASPGAWMLALLGFVPLLRRRRR